MKMMLRVVSVLVLCVGLLGACTDDPVDPTPLDAGCGAACEDGGDAAVDEDSGRNPGVGGQDTDLDVEDANDGDADAQGDSGEPNPDADDGGDDVEDASEPTDADDDAGDASGGEEDGGDEGDAGEDPNAGRPSGQCNVSADCPGGGPGGTSCTRTAPGGICAGCSEFAGCEAGYDCNFGSCQASCAGDQECPPGMRCSRGGCIIQSCNEDGFCPDPMFGCNASGLCTRLSCDDPGDCPLRTTCEGGICIEDRQLTL